MSTTAVKFAQILKGINPPNANVRLARSLTLAHAFAMSVPVTNYADAEQANEAMTPLLKKVINEVNEFVAVDTRLTLASLLPTLKLRFELLNGTTDPAIINMVLRSGAAGDIKAPDDDAMTAYLLSRPSYAKEQVEICNSIRDLIAENS